MPRVRHRTKYGRQQKAETRVFRNKRPGRHGHSGPIRAGGIRGDKTTFAVVSVGTPESREIAVPHNDVSTVGGLRIFESVAVVPGTQRRRSSRQTSSVQGT